MHTLDQTTKTHDLVSDYAGASITAIVPARNEKEVIASCVRSLARQAEIREIVVVDDQSTDGTPDIVRRLTAETPYLRLQQTQEVPRGWVGKNNAAWIGTREADSTWLLFTDADAELAPGSAAQALQIARETGAALVSFSPEQITQAWYEKSLIPFVYWRLARHFSFQEVNDPASNVAAANGQFLMIRRDAYEAIGGHASVAGEVLEDVALAKRVKAAGYRLWFGPGKDVVRARMYRSFDSMWEGWKKNLYLLVGGTPGTVYRELFSVVPWIPVLLLVLGIKVPLAFLVGVGLLVARHAAYGLTLSSNRFSPWLTLYYVPAVVLYTGVLGSSYRAHRKGKVEWKGRQVSVGVPGALRQTKS